MNGIKSKQTTWRKVKLGEVMTTARVNFEKVKTSEYKRTGSLPIFDQGSDTIAGYTDNPKAEYKGKSPAILFGDHTLKLKIAEPPFALGADGIQILEPDKDVLDRNFFYYALKGLKVRSYGYERHMKYLRELEIACPSITIQKRIAEILSAFDDKIELNNKISKNLEAMAQAIFKEWFVNFRFPGHEKVKMVDSELGKIPEGWEVETLGGLVANIVDRYSGDNKRDRKPYVPIDVISSKKLALENFAQPEEAQSSLIQFRENDILFGAMRPYFHKVAVAPFSGLTRTTCFILRPIKYEYWGFVVMLLFSNEAVDYATSHSQGTTIPYAKWIGSFVEMPVIKPKEDIAEIYNQFFHPIIGKIKVIASENQKLVALRDLLLPKLMSGEIWI